MLPRLFYSMVKYVVNLYNWLLRNGRRECKLVIFTIIKGVYENEKLS
jgi:hypothetical protein